MYEFDSELIKLYNSIKLHIRNDEDEKSIEKLTKHFESFKSILESDSKYSKNFHYIEHITILEEQIEDLKAQQFNYTNFDFFTSYISLIKNSDKPIFDIMLKFEGVFDLNIVENKFNLMTSLFAKNNNIKVIKDENSAVVFLKSSAYESFYKLCNEQQFSNYKLTFKLPIPNQPVVDLNNELDFKGIERNKSESFNFPLHPTSLFKDFVDNITEYNIQLLNTHSFLEQKHNQFYHDLNNLYLNMVKSLDSSPNRPSDILFDTEMDDILGFLKNKEEYESTTHIPKYHLINTYKNLMKNAPDDVFDIFIHHDDIYLARPKENMVAKSVFLNYLKENNKNFRITKNKDILINSIILYEFINNGDINKFFKDYISVIFIPPVPFKSTISDSNIVSFDDLNYLKPYTDKDSKLKLHKSFIFNKDIKGFDYIISQFIDEIKSYNIVDFQKNQSNKKNSLNK